MSDPVQAFTRQHATLVVDAAELEAFLAPAPDRPANAILFFAGAGQNRPETSDVAVILPELLRAFAGRLRAAVIAPEAEQALRARFQVHVFPSLVITRGVEPVGVLQKVWDWSDYLTKIECWLAPDAPPLPALSAGPPRVEIVHSARN